MPPPLPPPSVDSAWDRRNSKLCVIFSIESDGLVAPVLLSSTPSTFNCRPRAKMVRWHSANAAAAMSFSCEIVHGMFSTNQQCE